MNSSSTTQFHRGKKRTVCVCIVLQMIVGLQDSLRNIEHKMTASFNKMEERLVSIEERMVTQSDLVSKKYLLLNTLELGYNF